MSIKALQEKYIQKSTHPKVLRENWMSDDETYKDKNCIALTATCCKCICVMLHEHLYVLLR